VSSALSNSSVIAGVSWLQYPSLRHRRKNASNLARFAAEVKPAYAGAQYISLAGIYCGTEYVTHRCRWDAMIAQNS